MKKFSLPFHLKYFRWKDLPKTFDLWFWIVPVLLLAASIATLYSITLGSDRVYLTYHQLIYGILGLVLLGFFSFVDYRIFKSLAPLLYIIGIILLVLVLILGKKVLGAHRWIDLGFFQIQPSEFFKLATLLFLARLFSLQKEMGSRVFIFAILTVVLPVLLIIRQPDLGTAIILLVIGFVFWMMARASLKLKVGVLIVILLSLPLSWFVLKDYQKDRLVAFVNPTLDPQGRGYSAIQSVITIGSGGLWGRGLGNGPQSQLNFLPVAYTDFIFAGWAEATGFIGSLLMVAALVWLVLRILNCARLTQDSFGFYLGIGAACLIFMEVLINIGMNLGLLPITGIPLPLVSYGGTALVVNLILIGVLQNIYVHHKKVNF